MAQMLFVSFVALLLATVSASVEVNTALGKIRGVELKSRLGASFYAFRGIRYAEPPIGELRFRDPKPVAAWKPGVFDATKDGPICPQVTKNLTLLSEDCLRLNVYTKDVKGAKPVLFYIHPGGFYAGSGFSSYAGAEHFMERDIVLVTINYRLGSLGYLATGTAAAAGNAGLKDQVAAMRWVQHHIRDFGGDPRAVTLLGYSAGSLSIGLHLVSPMTAGLFQRGIMMSASPLGQWQIGGHQLNLAEKQARLLNCPTEPIAEAIKCLKQKPMMDYVNSMSDMFDFSWNPVLNWYPVIESDFGQERYLIEHPQKSIQSGHFNKVPLIIGINEFEFVSGAYYALLNDTIRKWLNEEFDKYAPIALMYERDTPRSKEISATLRWKYLKNATLMLPESLEPFGNLYSDAIIGFEFHRFLHLVSQHSPTYVYFFTYKGRYSHFKYEDKVYGAVHHDELLYLFHVPVLTPLFRKSDPENDTIERLTRMWTAFSTNGDPNDPNDEYLRNITWKLYSNSKKEYLEIGNELTCKRDGIYQERFKIWDELFPISEYP